MFVKGAKPETGDWLLRPKLRAPKCKEKKSEASITPTVSLVSCPCRQISGFCQGLHVPSGHTRL